MPCSVNFKYISAHLQYDAVTHGMVAVARVAKYLPSTLFKQSKKTTARAKYWERVALNLEKIDSLAVRDRYSRLTEKYKKKARREKSTSGISPEPT